ncbi:hypothetical protein [Mucilaginibacter gotjawali]|uniref:Uncharacterized protein n=1 Tax=Mucilaginibacter gotjawali TaxID=1550579 RepID=A0A839SG17_9SPHI|nr:hypothetical protein [Mucilaginibacter gotjawali]MBB3056746.1 hypothetical protein [Mucilaginibacter gotjawali]
MIRGKIKLVYKQEIGEKTESDFEKAIFKASYHEFLLKSQAYNPGRRFKTFKEMQEADGRANSLHYKLSFSVLYFISQLNNTMPVIKDNLGNKLCFETPRFELIASHTEDISQHKVAVYYETGTLTLLEFMGEYLLLSYSNKAENEAMGTFVVKIQPNLSILNYQGIAHPQMAWIASQQ